VLSTLGVQRVSSWLQHVDAATDAVEHASRMTAVFSSAQRFDYLRGVSHPHGVCLKLSGRHTDTESVSGI